jgi:hypothetical protein
MSVAKANSYRVDTTPQVYSTKLAGLKKKSLHILRKVQSISTSIMTKCAEHRDLVHEENFHVGDAALRERALSLSEGIKNKVTQMSRWEDKFDDLGLEVASVEEDLKWIVAGRSAHADGETAGPGDVPIAVD